MTAAVRVIDPAVEAIFLEPQGVFGVARDGGQLPLTDCHWIQIAPCGCINAITLAAIGDEIIASADAAMRSFAETKAEADKSSKLGFTAHLIAHDNYKPVVLPRFGDCTHDPKWGYKRTTKVVDGIEFTCDRRGEWSAGDWTVEKGRTWWVARGPDRKRHYLSSVAKRAFVEAAALIAEQRAAA